MWRAPPARHWRHPGGSHGQNGQPRTPWSNNRGMKYMRTERQWPPRRGFPCRGGSSWGPDWVFRALGFPTHLMELGPLAGFAGTSAISEFSPMDAGAPSGPAAGLPSKLAPLSLFSTVRGRGGRGCDPMWIGSGRVGALHRFVRGPGGAGGLGRGEGGGRGGSCRADPRPLAGSGGGRRGGSGRGVAPPRPLRDSWGPGALPCRHRYAPLTPRPRHRPIRPSESPLCRASNLPGRGSGRSGERSGARGSAGGAGHERR